MTVKKDSLKTLSRIAQILEKSQPSENPLAHIVMMVREQMKVDVCSLYLLLDKKLLLVATDGLDASSVGKVQMSIHEGLTGLAVEKLQPVIVNEASQHPRFKYFPETGEEKFHSFAAIPLLERGKVVGVLTIQTIQPRDFDSHEMDLLKLIAFQLAGVIQNLVTLETLQVSTDKDIKHLQFSGIPVAPGFGIGPAFFIRPGIDPVILPPDGSDVKKKLDEKSEWKKLVFAIRETATDLLRLEKKIQKKFSKSESDIFYSHRMILSDKSFLKKLKEEIQKGKNALESISAVIGEYLLEFEKIEDAHLRERMTDLEDIRQRVMDHLLGKRSRKLKETWEGILIAETLVPSDTVRLDPERIRGIVTVRGGITSHAAILARSMGIPAVMGVPGILQKIHPGDLLIVDGNVGQLYVNPEKPVLQEYERSQSRYADQLVHLQSLSEKPCETKDGRRIHLEANVGLVSGLKKIKQLGAEGVGLYRTEFPFMVRKKLPSENEQVEIYEKILSEADQLPVTFRLLDAGGDKPVEALGLTKEANPFLGYRSIRLSLSRPELLKDQLRALLRVSEKFPGLVRILVPMISGMEEMRAVKKIYEEVKQGLTLKGVAFDPLIPFGIMIEVPSAVQLAHLLIKDCDFFSIGTNDLIQYTLAVDRNNEHVAQFFEPLHPAILASIAHVVRVGMEHNKPVAICGEVAGDPVLSSLLVGMGVTQLSMIPSNIPAVKNVLLNINYSEAKEVAERVLRASTVEEIKEILNIL